jgi:hypothetical protein
MPIGNAHLPSYFIPIFRSLAFTEAAVSDA